MNTPVAIGIFVALGALVLALILVSRRLIPKPAQARMAMLAAASFTPAEWRDAVLHEFPYRFGNIDPRGTYTIVSGFTPANGVMTIEVWARQ